MISPNFWQGKTVLLTGHTGFKGAWLALWLEMLGAKVVGYALKPPTEPSLYEASNLAASCVSVIGDVRDAEHLMRIVQEHQPEIVFHLAAQPLVRLSYALPHETFASNVMGTVNVLEAIRTVGTVRSAVMITTDKVYENAEWIWSYRENDRLGGYDPYSASKAAAEMAISAYTTSFFHPDNYSQHRIALASARAGNVIGGGDWAKDRIVPDIVRAILSREALTIRFPQSVRPWQHVLEPLGGYLVLAEALYKQGATLSGAWNFAPAYSEKVSVGEIVQIMSELWGEALPIELAQTDQPHETTYLQLDAVKAARMLNWKAVLTMPETFAMTADWYKRYAAGEDMRRVSTEQISAYMKALESRSLAASGDAMSGGAV
ncbi:MAG: CDP-glucose 4,6-dehydratase [Candidatus Kapaibacterium sp.]|nr:MAG: CDP-glucose 4,6-dehydratase [Candidatus Kapabacteria bacterium]